MSLDLYCGALSKFYARDFETPQVRFSRENGLEHQTLLADGFKVYDREQGKKQIAGFFKNLTSYFSDNGEKFEPWDEETNEYLTEQLNSDCFLDLQLMCLSAYRKKDYSEFCHATPEYESALEMQSREEYFESGHAVLECQLFVPAIHDQCTPANDGLGGRVIMATTSNLKTTLKKLNNTIWNGNAQPDLWFKRGPIARGKTMRFKRTFPFLKRTLIEVQEKLPEKHVLKGAEYAFGVFTKVLEFSEKNNLPIRHDS